MARGRAHRRQPTSRFIWCKVVANVRPQLTQATGHFTFAPGYGASGISPAASRIGGASSGAYLRGMTRTVIVGTDIMPTDSIEYQ